MLLGCWLDHLDFLCNILILCLELAMLLLILFWERKKRDMFKDQTVSSTETDNGSGLERRLLSGYEQEARILSSAVSGVAILSGLHIIALWML